MGKTGGGLWAALIAVGSLLVTGVAASIAYLELNDAKERERVQRVMHFTDALTDLAEADARIIALSDDFLSNWPAIAAAAGDNATGEQLDETMNAWFANTIDDDPDLSFALRQMAQFYDTIAVCVFEGLCDEKTAEALFRRQVKEFTSIVYPWVKRGGAERDGIGVQTMCLRNRFCGGQTECTGLPAKLKSCDQEISPPTK